MLAITILAELVEQSAQAASCKASAAPEKPTKQTSQAARQGATKTTWQSSTLTAEHPAEATLATQNVPEHAAMGATLRTGTVMLEGLGRQQHH